MVQITIEIDDKNVRGLLEDIVEEILEDEISMGNFKWVDLNKLEKGKIVKEIVDEIMEDESFIEEIFRELIEEYVDDIGPVELSASDGYEELVERVEEYLKRNYESITV